MTEWQNDVRETGDEENQFPPADRESDANLFGDAKKIISGLSRERQLVG
ncbi:MAG: hypothetical protein IH623_28055 [Verrucomicrobia bacterium]|nr:hypothetical protein [Verrucomicrobiota bacterium]